MAEYSKHVQIEFVISDEENINSPIRLLHDDDDVVIEQGSADRINMSHQQFYDLMKCLPQLALQLEQLKDPEKGEAE